MIPLVENDRDHLQPSAYLLFFEIECGQKTASTFINNDTHTHFINNDAESESTTQLMKTHKRKNIPSPPQIAEKKKRGENAKSNDYLQMEIEEPSNQGRFNFVRLFYYRDRFWDK